MDHDKPPEDETPATRNRGEDLPASPGTSQSVRAVNLVPAATRRANFWLLIALVVFAVAFTIIIFLWMRGVVRANGGIVDPQRRTSLFVPSRQPVPAADFVLPTAVPCFT